eukprot:CAMPEP_0204165970 /NCGR_PEP_ID=MMETSP0361-20130328/38609_1 /ASSEMBLY_ACC=CAM_ASM_000343 /TAXON_ID=268821 /ORGANISM="Scrippsiella Hangoei, Strain SHTV-5" /LENGTH=91 /DNA_ID=CAMNT_0051123043 /DNA_START=26 /DNA_END=298 /DNA_ORIENTATION=+
MRPSCRKPAGCRSPGEGTSSSATGSRAGFTEARPPPPPSRSSRLTSKQLVAPHPSCAKGGAPPIEAMAATLRPSTFQERTCAMGRERSLAE